MSVKEDLLRVKRLAETADDPTVPASANEAFPLVLQPVFFLPGEDGSCAEKVSGSEKTDKAPTACSSLVFFHPDTV